MNLKSTIEIEREKAIEDERKKFAKELKRIEELEEILRKKDVIYIWKYDYTIFLCI